MVCTNLFAGAIVVLYVLDFNIILRVKKVGMLETFRLCSWIRVFDARANTPCVCVCVVRPLGAIPQRNAKDKVFSKSARCFRRSFGNQRPQLLRVECFHRTPPPYRFCCLGAKGHHETNTHTDSTGQHRAAQHSTGQRSVDAKQPSFRGRFRKSESLLLQSIFFATAWTDRTAQPAKSPTVTKQPPTIPTSVARNPKKPPSPLSSSMCTARGITS